MLSAPQVIARRIVQRATAKYATKGKTVKQTMRPDGSIKTETGPGEIPVALTEALAESIAEVFHQVLTEVIVEANVTGETETGDTVTGTASGSLK